MYLSIYFLVALVQLHASDTCKYTDSSHLSQRKRLDLYQLRPRVFSFFDMAAAENVTSAVYIILVKLSDASRSDLTSTDVQSTKLTLNLDPLIVSKYFLSNSDHSHAEMQQ